MATTKKSTKRSKKQELIVDQTARFEIGHNVEISTDRGWTAATVTKILPWPTGIVYQVEYIPAWEKNGKSYGTVATGLAIREVQVHG